MIGCSSIWRCSIEILRWFQGKTLNQQLAKTSIRGRVALITACLEKARAHFQVQNKELDAFIDLMWTYCETNRLDLWHKQALEGPGGNFLDILEPHQKQSSSHNQVPGGEEKSDQESSKPPLPIPLLLLQLVEAAIDAGIGNLYAGVEGYSSETFEAALRAISLMQKQEIEVPDIQIFARSSFSEFHGWGNQVPRSFFKGDKKN